MHTNHNSNIDETQGEQNISLANMDLLIADMQFSAPLHTNSVATATKPMDAELMKLDAEIKAKYDATTKTQTDLEQHDADAYAESVEEYTKSNEGLNALYNEGFSDKPESFWLGTGRLSSLSETIKNNIKNGTMGQALTAGSLLSTLTRRDWKIRSEFDNVANPTPSLYAFINGKPSDGKSPVINSMIALKLALSSIDDEREIYRKRTYKTLVQAEKDEADGSVGTTYVNPVVKDVNLDVIVSDCTIPALVKKLYSQQYFSKQADMLGDEFKTNIGSRSTLLYSTEGGLMIQRILGKGSIGSDETPTLNLASDGEPIINNRSTDNVNMRIDSPRLGILFGLQPYYYMMILKRETEVGGPNNGFGLRFAVMNLRNTERENHTVSRADHSKPKRNLENAHTIHEARTQMEKISEGFALSTAEYIVFDDDAGDLLFTMFKDLLEEFQESFHGWMEGYSAKVKSNVMKAAWQFQMVDFFNRDLPDVAVALEPTIGVQAVRQAMEFIRMTTYTAIYHNAINSAATHLAEKQKEIMLPDKVTTGKYHNILNDPALLDSWLNTFSSARDAKHAINGKTRKQMNAANFDYNAIIDAAWKRTHS